MITMTTSNPVISSEVVLGLALAVVDINLLLSHLEIANNSGMDRPTSTEMVHTTSHQSQEVLSSTSQTDLVTTPEITVLSDWTK